MTIQSEATTSTLNRPSSVDAAKKYTATDGVLRTLSLHAPHQRTESKPSSLLDAFVHSFKELESYKYVHWWLLSLPVLIVCTGTASPLL